jgi:hypothetical protein
MQTWRTFKLLRVWLIFSTKPPIPIKNPEVILKSALLQKEEIRYPEKK